MEPAVGLLSTTLQDMQASKIRKWPLSLPFWDTYRLHLAAAATVVVLVVVMVCVYACEICCFAKK